MTITEKENLLRLVSGQEPAWVPRKGMIPYADVDPEHHSPPSKGAFPALFPPKPTDNGGRVDMFGVEYEATDSTGGLALPMPNKFILDDITKWRDVIKVPSLEGIDWEAVAKKAVEHIDRRDTCVDMGTHVGYFQHLMNFMGFTEGLCALQEEPEEVMALYDYLADFYDTIALNLIDYIKPDFFGITDDTATARSPFISVEMYKDIVKPYHARLGKIAQDRGIPVEMHNCGRCEDVIDDWIEFGVKIWNPAQIMNDLVGIKKKYGNSLILTGCWDSQGPPGWPGTEEEVVRQAVRDCIDTYAPGGGFCFWASLYGSKENEAQARKHAFWITDEYNKYGRTFYQKQG
ncbi:MAG: veratrol--corrinoid protein metyltransferase [Clostridiales bacterium]|nr:veratrol--corrinoid protein metyltransferase [Clostridiales bacterium]